MTALNDDGLPYLPDPTADRVKLPVVAEMLEMGISRHETGRVVIRKTVETEERLVDARRVIEHAEVRRVPVGRVVDAPVAARTEGGVMIVPIHEERVLVTRQLVIVEELHIALHRTEEEDSRRVTLRTEAVSIERVGRDDVAEQCPDDGVPKP